MMDTNESTPQGRDTLHRLVDDLPESTLREAENYLRVLRAYPDPVERTLYLAPIDDEFESEEERRAAKEAHDEWLRDEVRSLEDVRRELGL